MVDKPDNTAHTAHADRLTTPRGFALRDDGNFEIEVIFDGEAVTFRDPDGSISVMGTLCYLDYVMVESANELLDDEGHTLREDNIGPGDIVCMVLDYLHTTYHQRHMQDQINTIFSEVHGGDPDGPNILGAFMVDPTTGAITQVAGPDGVIHDPETVEPEEQEEGEIVIQGIRVNGNKTKH